MQLKALSHHGVSPERMPTYAQNSSKMFKVQERPTAQRVASQTLTQAMVRMYARPI